MDKYKINRNRKRLTEQDAAKGKDFERFLSAYEARKAPFYRTTKFYISLSVVGALVAVGSYMALPSKETPVERPFIDPLVSGVTVPDTLWTADAAKADTFAFWTGSDVYVPQEAFLDKDGKPVSGKVELRYREFHTPAEILVAGIPMTYDSAGQRRHFESAGMFEISAWQNGQPLKANPAHPIKIAMVSPTDEDRFNIYYLDTAKKAWDFVSRDKGELQRKAAPMDSVAPQATATTVAAPLKPAKATAGAHVLTIQLVDPGSFPELTVYKGICFEVDEKRTPYDPQLKYITWDDANVKRNSDETYTVTFTKDDKKYSFITRVVVKEKDYEAAMKVYDAKYAEYQAMLSTRQHENASHVTNLTKEQAKMDKERLAANYAAMQRATAMRGSLGAQTEDVVMRTFLVNNFGIWNSDCPSSLPQGPEIFVKLTDPNNKEMNPAHLYLVERGRNAIFTYYAHDLQHFRYNPNASNLLVAVTGENQVALIDNDEFTRVDTTKKEHTFKLQPVHRDLKSVEDVKAMLHL